jgi:hypothetical protein
MARISSGSPNARRQETSRCSIDARGLLVGVGRPARNEDGAGTVRQSSGRRGGVDRGRLRGSLRHARRRAPAVPVRRGPAAARLAAQTTSADCALDGPDDPDFFDCASWAAAAYAGNFPRTDRKSWFGQNRGRALGAWYQKSGTRGTSKISAGLRCANHRPCPVLLHATFACLVTMTF